MFKKTICLLLLSIFGTGYTWSAQRTDEEVDLQALYRQIDEAMSLAPQYAAKRLSQIDDTRKKLATESRPDGQLPLAEQLFELYKPYRNDSALYYISLCVALADSLDRKDAAGLHLAQKALLCSRADMYLEALKLLNQVDKRVLSREGQTMYYWAWMHVCGEIASYSQLPDERNDYFALQDTYRDSLLAVAADDSEASLHLRMDVLTARKLYQDALDVSDNWLSKVAEGTHEGAYAAFYRSIVYEKLENGRLVRYWLGKSALNDIKCAVNDQASLFMLAERLCDDGDYERAYRYVRFCEQCNTTFLPQLHKYQVRYVSNVMEAVCKDGQARYQRLLLYGGMVVLLLSAVVIWLLFFRCRCRCHVQDGPQAGR